MHVELTAYVSCSNTEEIRSCQQNNQVQGAYQSDLVGQENSVAPRKPAYDKLVSFLR